MLFAFKIFSLPVPTRPGTRPFLQLPDPSRPEVKNPYPSDPANRSQVIESYSLAINKQTAKVITIAATASAVVTWHEEELL